MSLLPQFIPFAVELTKQPVGKRVHDLLRDFRGRQVLLGDIGRMNRFIHQYVIPRFVPRGARARDLLVPRLGPLKSRIDIENDPDVIKQPVLNNFSDLEFCFVH